MQRAQAMLDARKAQGLDLPNVGEKKPVRPGTRVRPSKVKSQTSQEKGIVHLTFRVIWHVFGFASSMFFVGTPLHR